MADILIKGMEMPTSCEGCFACEEFSYESFDYCNILKAPTTRRERRMDCPLVALPSHGRLISDTDVKALLHSGLSLDTDSDIDHVCGLIDGLQTIVEASYGSDN